LHEVEGAGEAGAVGGAGEGFERGKEALDLVLLHFAHQRMAQAHDVFRALEVGEFRGIVLHGGEKLGDGVLCGGDFGPIAASGGGE
jgi:hypothetical protein